MSRAQKPELAAVPARVPLDYTPCAAALAHAAHTENVEGKGRGPSTVAALALLCEIETLSDAIWNLSVDENSEAAAFTALSFMIQRRAQAVMQLLNEGD